MSNVSRWKNFEADVATVLGGRRRQRTTESYDLKVPDVYFPRKFRKKNPLVRQVVVECKKRQVINVHGMFAEATVKYGEDGAKRVILASQIPKRGLTVALAAFKEKLANQYAIDGPIWMRCLAKLKKKSSKKIRRRDLRRIEKQLQKRFKKSLERGSAKLRARKATHSLVTVDIGFFEDLWNAWLLVHRRKNGI